MKFVFYVIIVTTQAREGIETVPAEMLQAASQVTTQAREGIETLKIRKHDISVT